MIGRLSKRGLHFDLKHGAGRIEVIVAREAIEDFQSRRDYTGSFEDGVEEFEATYEASAVAKLRGMRGHPITVPLIVTSDDLEAQARQDRGD